MWLSVLFAVINGIEIVFIKDEMAITSNVDYCKTLIKKFQGIFPEKLIVIVGKNCFVKPDYWCEDFAFLNFLRQSIKAENLRFTDIFVEV